MLHLLSLLLASLLSLLQLGDWLSTRAVIRRGVGREGNPIMAWLIELLGLDAAFLLKGLLITGISFALALPVVSVPLLLCVVMLAVLVGLYVWVVVHNLGFLRQ